MVNIITSIVLDSEIKEKAKKILEEEDSDLSKFFRKKLKEFVMEHESERR